MGAKKKVIATVINDVVFDQRMIRICNSLHHAGYEVTLLGRKLDTRANPIIQFNTKRLRFILRSGPLFYLAYNIRVFFYLLFSRYDIVHSVDLDTLPAGFLASRIKRKKIVYDAHELFTEVPELLNRPAKRKVWLRIESYFLPKVGKGITVSSGLATEFTKRYNIPFTVIRNMPLLENDIQNPAEPEDERYLLYQGALNKGRGLEALIEAMVSLDAKLKIAGKGDLEDELKLMVKERMLDSKIEFLGNLLPDALKSVTSKAYLGINVSENLGLSYFYSLNNKFFDYVHAGLPAVTNPFPEYQELDKSYHCVIFADSNPGSLVKSINLLLNDTVLYAELKKNCFLARTHWNWNREEERLLNYYANY